jgi:hypothetical protein
MDSGFGEGHETNSLNCGRGNAGGGMGCHVFVWYPRVSKSSAA